MRGVEQLSGSTLIGLPGVRCRAVEWFNTDRSAWCEV